MNIHEEKRKVAYDNFMALYIRGQFTKYETCTDPGIIFRGEGGPDRTRLEGQKTVWTTLLLVFFCFFLVLNLFYSLQRGLNGYITDKTILFQGSRGGPTFFRGVQLFPGWGGGPKC